MTYRVFSSHLRPLVSNALAATESKSHPFSLLTDALTWASNLRGANFAVVVVEEPAAKVTIRSPEDAARSVP